MSEAIRISATPIADEQKLPQFINAPTSNGSIDKKVTGLYLTTVDDGSGLQILALGIVDKDQRSIAVLLNDDDFDKFCAMLSPHVLAVAERERARGIGPWTGMTVQ